MAATIKRISPDLVMTTVNAPHRDQLGGDALAQCLLDPALARSVAGHMSVFFGEVAPAQQIAFALSHGISKLQLAAAARAFSAYSGETYPLAA